MSDRIAVDEELAFPQMIGPFRELQPSLIAFAEEHNLAVHRFKRGHPIWLFMSRHPRGGSLTLQLNLSFASSSDEIVVTIDPFWHLDDETTNTRTSAELAPAIVDSLRAADVKAALEDELRKLLKTERRALTKKSQIMPRPRDENGSPLYGIFDWENLPEPR